MKSLLCSLVALCLLGTAIAGDLTYTVKQTSDWVFYSPNCPQIEVIATNGGTQTAQTTLALCVTTDDNQPISHFVQQFAVAPQTTNALSFSFSVPSPGFYRCTLLDGEDNIVKKFNIGYEPENIVSLCDAQPDLKAFWDQARAELATVAPQYELTLLPEQSNKTRNIYLVKMQSLGGETISGYYATPTKKGKYPAIITFMGYGSEPWLLKANDNPQFVEFVLSVRGQGLNKADNKYGDWITYGLGDKERYYYRGAFMDLIRAIDFVASRDEVRDDAIFAEGGSQGGAFTLAACALDHRICAAAPYIPFLSDYADYFRIVHWPAEVVINKQRELSLSDVDLYRMLSYFDIKNLAPWITCPIKMGAGLQDEVCPPHTNFSGYNRISTEKSYTIFPTCGHDVGAAWWPARMEFFKKHIQ
ncbi:MAG: acetylxylan esterase [Alistipes sp.]